MIFDKNPTICDNCNEKECLKGRESMVGGFVSREEVSAALAGIGIDLDSSAAWMITDRDERLSPGRLIVLLMRDSVRAVTFPGCLPVFEEKLDLIEGLSLEEEVSGCRLVCTVGGSVKIVASMSYTYKDDAFRLVEVFEKIKGGQTYVRNEPEFRFCKRCGMHYPEKGRDFCPNCLENGRVLKRMSVFFKKYIPQMVITLLLLILTSAVSVIAPYLRSGFYYDEVLSADGSFYGKIVFVLTLIISLRLVRIAIEIVSQIVNSRISAKLCYDMKKTIFHSIEQLSVSFFSARSTGGLMNQVNSDAERIYWFFTDGVPVLVINIVQFVAVLCVMLSINPLLTVLSVLLFPLALFLVGKVYNRNRNLRAKRYSGERAMSGMLSDFLSGIRVVKSFAGERREFLRFCSYNKRLAKASKNSSVFSAIAFPVLNLIIYTGVIIVWAVGGWMVINDSFGMTYGLLLTFVAYISMIYEPVYSVIDLSQNASESMNAMSRLLEILDAKPDVCQSDHPIGLDNCKGSVSFRNVKFSYVRNRTVIDGISFDIAAGENIGIVGHTGAGKSTIANLLIRLYDVDDGEILIDGINVKDISFSDLHRNIAIVSQETYLFAGTILENIRYSCPEATNTRVVAAAKAAGAHDFISMLPDGYETKIGQGYKELSGGERQRISIARALLRDPKILILDEATAAMDTKTEQTIQKTLDRLSKGRTTITIAHRLSTLKNADRLFVIKDRKICESGKPAELIAKKGVYWRLYTLQLEALRDAGIVE